MTNAYIRTYVYIHMYRSRTRACMGPHGPTEYHDLLYRLSDCNKVVQPEVDCDLVWLCNIFLLFQFLALRFFKSPAGNMRHMYVTDGGGGLGGPL